MRTRRSAAAAEAKRGVLITAAFLEWAEISASWSVLLRRMVRPPAPSLSRRMSSVPTAASLETASSASLITRSSAASRSPAVVPSAAADHACVVASGALECLAHRRASRARFARGPGSQPRPRRPRQERAPLVLWVTIQLR